MESKTAFASLVFAAFLLSACAFSRDLAGVEVDRRSDVEEKAEPADLREIDEPEMVGIFGPKRTSMVALEASRSPRTALAQNPLDRASRSLQPEMNQHEGDSSSTPSRAESGAAASLRPTGKPLREGGRTLSRWRGPKARILPCARGCGSAPRIGSAGGASPRRAAASLQEEILFPESATFFPQRVGFGNAFAAEAVGREPFTRQEHPLG